MRIPLLYEKIYIRKKIDEYSLPWWLEKIIYILMIIKFLVIYPFIGLFFYILIEMELISWSLLFIFSYVYISFEARDFPQKNYLVYTLKQHLPITHDRIYKKVYLRMYFYFLCKYTYKYFMFFWPVFFNTNIVVSLAVFFAAVLVINSFMNFSSYSFYRKYSNQQVNSLNGNIKKFLIYNMLFFIVIVGLLNKFAVNIDIFLFDFHSIRYAVAILFIIFFAYSVYLHHFKVIKKLGSKERPKQEEDITSYTNFYKWNFLRKDLLVIKRTFHTRLAFLKVLLAGYTIMLAIAPFILEMIFPGNSTYIIFSVIVLALAFSNIATDYLKKMISPDIEYFSIPNHIVERMQLNKLFVQKIFFYFLFSLYPAFLSMIILAVYKIDPVYILSSMILIVVIFINMGMASTAGAILYPKLNPESEFEFGNSKKATAFENIYLYFVSCFIAVIILQDLMAGVVSFNLAVYMLVLIVIQLGLLLIGNFYFRNIKVRDVLGRGD